MMTVHNKLTDSMDRLHEEQPLHLTFHTYCLLF